jgi:hypothetical protein
MQTFSALATDTTKLWKNTNYPVDDIQHLLQQIRDNAQYLIDPQFKIDYNPPTTESTTANTQKEALLTTQGKITTQDGITHTIPLEWVAHIKTVALDLQISVLDVGELIIYFQKNIEKSSPSTSSSTTKPTPTAVPLKAPVAPTPAPAPPATTGFSFGGGFGFGATTAPQPSQQQSATAEFLKQQAEAAQQQRAKQNELILLREQIKNDISIEQIVNVVYSFYYTRLTNIMTIVLDTFFLAQRLYNQIHSQTLQFNGQNSNNNELIPQHLVIIHSELSQLVVDLCSDGIITQYCKLLQTVTTTYPTVHIQQYYRCTLLLSQTIYTMISTPLYPLTSGNFEIVVKTMVHIATQIDLNKRPHRGLIMTQTVLECAILTSLDIHASALLSYKVSINAPVQQHGQTAVLNPDMDQDDQFDGNANVSRGTPLRSGSKRAQNGRNLISNLDGVTPNDSTLNLSLSNITSPRVGGGQNGKNGTIDLNTTSQNPISFTKTFLSPKKSSTPRLTQGSTGISLNQQQNVIRGQNDDNLNDLEKNLYAVGVDLAQLYKDQAAQVCNLSLNCCCHMYNEETDPNNAQVVDQLHYFHTIGALCDHVDRLFTIYKQETWPKNHLYTRDVVGLGVAIYACRVSPYTENPLLLSPVLTSSIMGGLFRYWSTLPIQLINSEYDTLLPPQNIKITGKELIETICGSLDYILTFFPHQLIDVCNKDSERLNNWVTSQLITSSGLNITTTNTTNTTTTQQQHQNDPNSTQSGLLGNKPNQQHQQQQQQQLQQINTTMSKYKLETEQNPTVYYTHWILTCLGTFSSSSKQFAQVLIQNDNFLLILKQFLTFYQYNDGLLGLVQKHREQGITSIQHRHLQNQQKTLSQVAGGNIGHNNSTNASQPMEQITPQVWQLSRALGGLLVEFDGQNQSNGGNLGPSGLFLTNNPSGSATNGNSNLESVSGVPGFLQLKFNVYINSPLIQSLIHLITTLCVDATTTTLLVQLLKQPRSILNFNLMPSLLYSYLYTIKNNHNLANNFALHQQFELILSLIQAIVRTPLYQLELLHLPLHYIEYHSTSVGFDLFHGTSLQGINQAFYTKSFLSHTATTPQSTTTNTVNSVTMIGNQQQQQLQQQQQQGDQINMNQLQQQQQHQQQQKYQLVFASDLTNTNNGNSYVSPPSNIIKVLVDLLCCKVSLTMKTQVTNTLLCLAKDNMLVTATIWRLFDINNIHMLPPQHQTSSSIANSTTPINDKTLNGINCITDGMSSVTTTLSFDSQINHTLPSTLGPSMGNSGGHLNESADSQCLHVSQFIQNHSFSTSLSVESYSNVWDDILITESKLQTYTLTIAFVRLISTLICAIDVVNIEKFYLVLEALEYCPNSAVISAFQDGSFGFIPTTQSELQQSQPIDVKIGGNGDSGGQNGQLALDGSIMRQNYQKMGFFTQQDMALLLLSPVYQISQLQELVAELKTFQSLAASPNYEDLFKISGFGGDNNDNGDDSRSNNGGNDTSGGNNGSNSPKGNASPRQQRQRFNAYETHQKLAKQQEFLSQLIYYQQRYQSVMDSIGFEGDMGQIGNSTDNTNINRNTVVNHGVNLVNNDFLSFLYDFGGAAYQQGRDEKKIDSQSQNSWLYSLLPTTKFLVNYVDIITRKIYAEQTTRHHKHVEQLWIVQESCLSLFLAVLDQYTRFKQHSTFNLHATSQNVTKSNGKGTQQQQKQQQKQQKQQQIGYDTTNRHPNSTNLTPIDQAVVFKAYSVSIDICIIS